LFDRLSSARAAVGADFGAPLDWQRLDDKRGCRIVAEMDIGGYRDEESWPEIHEAMIDCTLRLDRATRHRLQEL
jgi:hypothetical protein